MMAECLARAVRLALDEVNLVLFRDGVSAMSALDDALPDLIILDVLLSGPDGFTFLNELISYYDTAQIPVIIVSSLDLAEFDLKHYGVVDFLHKEWMTPKTIGIAVVKALGVRGSCGD